MLSGVGRVRARLEEERKKEAEEARRSALEKARQMPQSIISSLDYDTHDGFHDDVRSDDIKVRCDVMALRSA